MASFSTKEIIKIIKDCQTLASKQGGNWWDYTSQLSGYAEGLPFSKISMDDDDSDEKELILIEAIKDLIY